MRNLPLPVKWMSPESLKYQFFDERTDVWSFGITIWEIMSRGAVPFPKVATEPSLFLQYLEKGNRPKQPSNCPDDVFKVITKCLDMNKWKRYDFLELKSKFEELLLDYPAPPPRHHSLNQSHAGSWRMPNSSSRHDSVITLTAAEIDADKPPPYASIHSNYI